MGAIGLRRLVGCYRCVTYGYIDSLQDYSYFQMVTSYSVLLTSYIGASVLLEPSVGLRFWLALVGIWFWDMIVQLAAHGYISSVGAQSQLIADLGGGTFNATRCHS